MREIKRVLIVDTETNGLNPDTDRIIEVAAILYSVEHRTTLQQFSSILTMEEPSNACEEVNRISVGAIKASEEFFEGQGNQLAHDHLAWMYEASDIICAHNAEFDKAFLKQIGWTEFDNWICTKTECRWPKALKSTSLVEIAVAYNVPVVEAHRALDDCRLIAAIFDKQDDLQAVFNYALTPKEIYVSHLPIEKNDINKANGFIWDRIIPRHWARKMTSEEAAALDFPVSKAVLL